MVIKGILAHDRNGADEILELDVLIERLKRLRALNKKPNRIGLTQYTWRSFSIDKTRGRNEILW